MAQDILDRINKVFNLNLRQEDLTIPRMEYFVGYRQKSKRDNAGCRLFIDTIINIKGLDEYSIGITSYRFDNPICDCCLGYYSYWSKKSDKKYGVTQHTFENINQTFEYIFSKQLDTTPCVQLQIDNIEYIGFLMNNTSIWLYDTNNKITKIVFIEELIGNRHNDIDKNKCITVYKLLKNIELISYNEIAKAKPVKTKDQCKQIYTTAKIHGLTIKEYLYGVYLCEYSKILDRLKSYTSQYKPIDSFFK